MKFRIFLAFALTLTVSATHTRELTIAAWNLEHLNADGAEGCIERTQSDYEIITKHIHEMRFDVVALQEIKDVAAARRVFSGEEWNIELSNRRASEPDRECWGAAGRMLQHLATGFAIRKGIDYVRHEDYSDLTTGNDFQRFGTDITISSTQSVRLLSVHLASGCWGPPQDEDPQRSATCETLDQQFDHLAAWIDDRRAHDENFVVLGDFNRRLAMQDDWGWKKLVAANADIALLTGNLEAKCDPRYTDLIDHLIVGGSTEELVVMNSVREGERVAESPDHCSVSARFTL